MQYLRYNTDSQEVVFGMFVDSTDGNTEETGLTIANTDIKIWKSGATTLANKNSGGATHISNGIYYAVFDATDTNTLGSGKAFIHVSGALYQVLEFCVLPQKVYDSMIAGSDNLEVDTIQIEGTDATNQLNAATPSVTVTTNNDKTGYSLSSAGVTAVQSGLSTFDPSSDTVAHVTLVDTCTENTDMRGTDGANTTTPPTVEQIQSGLATSTEISSLNDITVSDILAGETETGLTLKHAIQIMTALALKASGGGTTSISFRDYGDTKNRITMTVDANGNRSEVVVSLD